MSQTSPLRQTQWNAVRDRIVEAAIAMIEAGEEPQMRSVAAAAEISERTIYRYFASRDELSAALMPTLKTRASAPLPGDVHGLEGYARRLYTTFSRNARLTRALTRAAWASTERTRRANLKGLRALVDAGFPRAPESDRASAAASLRVVLSASGWVYLDECGFGLEASVAHAQWIVRVALERLAQLEGGEDA